MKKNFFIILFLINFFGFFKVSNAQTISDKTTDTLSSGAKNDTSIILDFTRLKFTTASVIVQSENFNQGSISDIALLLQGKVAGLSIYNKGGDPNQSAIMQIRGINTMGSYVEPLIVIDGIVGATLSNIDPNDIQKIEVLKDGASCAKYGIRGSMGVIVINTKKAGPDLPIFTYKGQTGISSSLGSVDVMSADEFRKTGGWDFGSNTDWVKEITRSGLISNHHLATQLYKGKTGIRVSGNYRDVEGILKSSGFRQKNIRTNFNTSLLNDRLKIDLNASVTNRISNVSFKDAFKYAISNNPTMPVYGKDAKLPFNSAYYGGYYELIGAYDAYNPVSILNQSLQYIESNTLNVNGNIRYNVMSDFALNINYGYQNMALDQRAFFPTTAYYNKEQITIGQKGLVEFLNERNNFNFFESTAEYNRNFKNIKLNINTGYAIQQMRYTSTFKRLADFRDDYTFSAFDEKIDTSQGSIYKSIEKYGPQDRIVSYFAGIQLNVKDILLLEGRVRKDGSSRLGENNRWGVFHSLGGTVDLLKLLSVSGTHHLMVRMGYGVTGSLPQEYGLSQKLKQDYFGQDGSLSTQILRLPNPDLQWEEKKGVNFGIDYSKAGFSASLNVYRNKVAKLIRMSYINRRYENLNTIQTDGLELGLNYKVINNSVIRYSTGIQLSSYKSVLNKCVIKRPFTGWVDNIGGFILLQEDEEIGSFVGPVFDGFTNAGDLKYKDINNDGKFVVDYLTFSGIEDLKILGKGTPDVELGWSHKMDIGKWHLNAFFRGAFGHSMINANRMAFEPSSSFYGTVGIPRLYNYVNTPKRVEGLSIRRFHSLYVEKADFLKLDNFTITRSIELKKNSKIRKINVSLTGQNLFVFTNYTSGDPEPNLVDYTFQPYSVYPLINRTDNSVISPGIDQRNNYHTSRSFVLTVCLEF